MTVEERHSGEGHIWEVGIVKAKSRALWHYGSILGHTMRKNGNSKQNSLLSHLAHLPKKG